VNSLKQIVKKINLVKTLEYTAAAVILLMPFAAFALPAPDCNSLNGVRCDSITLNGLIRLIINWLLGIAFGIAVLFLIIGGFWYITSAGNEETAEKGKNTAINAIIGIVIIILSYVIVNVVSNLVSNPNSNPAS
jgi:hypothetical protein